MCNACGIEKPLDQYNKRAASKDGLNGWCRPCVNAKSTAWYHNNRERARKNHREWNLRSQYGISEADFLNLLEVQGGKCALCPVVFSTEGPRRNLCVDHDHDTGLVRGLLCARCNTSIGQLGDNAEGLRRALAYVEAGTYLAAAPDEKLAV
ncbi:endonuclease VII domain-containing protein [Streptomyces canus]|uniref:endonuclease VII domain-containing protein n=1 Tax=Streptomyces canus TaxID=58343 RepID=UPI003246911A